MYNASENLECVVGIIWEKVTFYKENICRSTSMEQIFELEVLNVVIYFSGYKVVGEFVEKPFEYYQNMIGILTF